MGELFAAAAMTTKSKKPASGLNSGAAGAPNAVSAPTGGVPDTVGSDAAVTDFIAKMNALAPSAVEGRGRLIFAMDATMSRQPTWDMALSIQSGMFAVVKSVGGLDVQLMYFRGHSECRASRWVSDPDQLAGLMRRVTCEGGRTQLERVLKGAASEARAMKINALVYVGDAMEENLASITAAAGELALLGVPVFLFQEGHDERAAVAFNEVARLTRGASCRFDAGSAQQLKDLLAAVAVYAAGGAKALVALKDRQSHRGARLLLTAMRGAGQR
jgi:hypothetical protein